MATLPRQAQRDLDDVEAMENVMRTPRDPAEPTLTVVNQDTGTLTMQDTPVTPPTPVEPSVPVVLPEAAEAAQKKQADFEQKYNTLRGKYDAEVPSMRSQIASLNAEMARLKTAFTEAETRRPAPVEPAKPVSLVTDADRDEFGEDMLDVSRRVATEVTESVRQQVEAQARTLDELRRAVDNSTNTMAAMDFNARLRALVPDFEEVNDDPSWHEWLNTYDPILRAPRRDRASVAYGAGDEVAVADYVRMWRGVAAPSDPEPSEQEIRHAELERQVTPTRTPSAAVAVSGPTRKTYTLAQANDVWAQITSLQRENRFEDADALEEELTIAYQTGRVQTT